MSNPNIFGPPLPRRQEGTSLCEDGKIDWAQTAHSIEPFIRAMNPWPGAWTEWQGKKLIIWRMSQDGTPAEVQPQNKKRMSFAEFMRGYPDFKTTDCR